MDDYIAAVVTGVIVDDATSVDIKATPRLYLARPAPNPATNGVTLRFGSADDADVTLEVFDVGGHLMKGWRGEGRRSHEVYWDMRDARGGAIASGVYLVRLRAGGAQMVRRLVCVR